MGRRIDGVPVTGATDSQVSATVTAAHAVTDALNPLGTVMRGTDGANVAVPDVAGTAAALHVTTDADIAAVAALAPHGSAMRGTDGANTTVPDAAGVVAALAPHGSAMRGTNGANTTVPDAAGVAAALHVTTDADIAAVAALAPHGSAMRGTDGANTTVPDAAGTAAALHAITDAAIAVNLAEILETERHIHNVERWFGPAAVASGEDHVADPLGEVGGTPPGVITSFRVTSGANKTWGTAIQVWGATDSGLMPATKQAFQDAHRLLPTNAEVNAHNWLLRIIAGTTAAAGVTANTYGTIPLFIENTNKVQTPVELITERVASGTKIWIQLLHTDDNTAKWVDIQFGIHGYPA